MKKEIRLVDAVTRWGEGKDTLVLIPSKDSEGNTLFIPSSFMKHMEQLGNSLFLIDDNEEENSELEDSLDLTKKNIEQINENIKPVEEKSCEEGVDEKILPKENQIKIDIGKMMALYDAGWAVTDIADELRINKATVYRYLKKVREGKLLPKGL